MNAAAAEEGESKEKIPVWQMVVLGVGLLAAGFMGLNATGVLGGGGDAPDAGLPPTDMGAPSAMDPAMPSAPAPPVSVPGAPGGNGSAAPSAAYTAPFTVVSQANPKASTGVMAIMPTSKTVTPEQAAQLAAFTYRTVVNAGRWPVFHIFVFNNAKAAEIFKEYQLKRRSAPLSETDYRQLSNIWPNTYVRYEYRKQGNAGVASVRYPYQNPNGWWQRQS